MIILLHQLSCIDSCHNNFFITSILFVKINYFAGGIGCEGVDRGQSRRCLDAVEIYNPDEDRWRDGPPLPSAQLSLRTNASNAGVVGGKIYVCGYYKGAGNTRSVIFNE